MRMLFLDEAGTGNPRDEPLLVVAGIIVNADKQWKAVQRRLRDLRDRFMPPEAPEWYSFHATELFSGGKYFTRERYSRSERWAILDAILSVPAEFNLPVVHAYLERHLAPDQMERLYGRAFIECAASAEAHLRTLPADEVGMIILEDNHEVRSQVRFMQSAGQIENHLLHAHLRDKYWLTKIVGEPHFEGKGPSSLLQIADACAFAIKRKAMERPHAERFVDPLYPQMINALSPWTARDEPERFA
ncbi:MAG: DUF3800 domain-containing protein [Alphaproteobacteria bacterium]|nr:DUF3800 domain-containing protein [Alphaproteobacteria bacterium]